MNINNHSDIAGIAARKLRDALRRMNPSFITADDMARRLNIPSEEADSLIKLLVRNRYLTHSRNSRSGECFYETTILGNALMNASAAPKLSRKTAERNLEQFMHRVNIINADPSYVFCISAVILFGSMVTGDGSVSDIDLAVELEANEKDPIRFQELSRKRIADARSAGKRFSTYTEALLWPRQEIYKFCSRRVRGVNLHDLSDLLALGVPQYRILLGEKDRIRKQIESLATTQAMASRVRQRELS
ncbi:MAG TPA: nucleotidyltransferase domain-containing protein [Terriglobales bacterium]